MDANPLPCNTESTYIGIGIYVVITILFPHSSVFVANEFKWIQDSHSVCVGKQPLSVSAFLCRSTLAGNCVDLGTFRPAASTPE
jgi:hypothetical protein